MKIKSGFNTQVGQRIKNIIHEIYGALFRVNIHNYSMKEIELMNHPINEH